MKTLKRNLDEEFDMYFDLYTGHWTEWIENGQHPFTPQQVKILRGYQYSGSLKAMSKKWKVPLSQLEPDFAAAIDVLIGAVWKYYTWCKNVHPEMGKLVTKQQNDIRFARAHISKSGLPTKLTRRLEDAGIITPLHIMVEDRLKIMKLAGPKGYKEIQRMFAFYGCLHMWH